MQACRIGSLDIVKLILNNENIDKEIFNKEGLNALAIAEISKEEFLADFLSENSSYSSTASSYSDSLERFETISGNPENDFILQRNFQEIISLLKK